MCYPPPVHHLIVDPIKSAAAIRNFDYKGVALMILICVVVRDRPDGVVFAYFARSMLKKVFIVILLVALAGCFFEDDDDYFGGWHGHHWHGEHGGHGHH